MTSSWQIYSVGDIAHVADYVANGSFASLKENVHYLDAPGFAILVRLVDHKRDWTGPLKWVDEHAYQFLAKSSLSAGDVVIANVGANAGTVFRVPELQFPATLGPNAIVVRGRPKICDNRYLSLFFESPTGQGMIQSITGGSAQPKFNKTDFRRLRVTFPPIEEQRRIAAVLGALDDKIELNRKMNRTLEEMAQALFKSWFIDFDGHEDLVDSELGPIPRGWTVRALSDVANISGGKQLDRNDYDEHGQYTVFGANGPMGHAAQPTHSGFVIAFGRVGAYCGSIHWTLDGAWINNNASAIQPFSAPFYTLQTLLNAPWEFLRSGSAQPFISQSALVSLRLVLPTEALAREYEALSAALRARQASNDKESRTLAQLRDLLLPKLISGELRAPETLDLTP